MYSCLRINRKIKVIIASTIPAKPMPKGMLKFGGFSFVYFTSVSVSSILLLFNCFFIIDYRKSNCGNQPL